MSNAILIILLVILVVFSAFFSCSEISFATANKARLKTAYDKGEKHTKLAYNISKDFPNTISSILVGNNLVNIAASSISTVLFTRLYGNDLGPTLSVIVVTVVILIFGEILPKLIGRNYANKLIYLLSLPLKFFIIIFKPIAFLVNKLVDLVAPLWTPKEATITATDEELVTIVDTIEDEGVIDEQKSDLIKSAIVFSEITAYEVMVPRVDVCALDIEDANERLVPNSDLLDYSYIPVYEETIDNIIGIISTKTVVKMLLNKEKIDVRKLLIQPLYFHETKPIDEIIKEMNSSHIHMAIVVDEFGGVDGILTSEDILEELVGEIWDEKDEVEYDYEKKRSNVYIVDGDMNIYDFFELVDVNTKDFDSEYSTVGGWVTEVLERFPKPKDKFKYKNLSIKVLSVDDMRVEKVQVNVHKIIEDEG